MMCLSSFHLVEPTKIKAGLALGQVAHSVEAELKRVKARVRSALSVALVVQFKLLNPYQTRGASIDRAGPARRIGTGSPCDASG